MAVIFWPVMEITVCKCTLERFYRKKKPYVNMMTGMSNAFLFASKRSLIGFNYILFFLIQVKEVQFQQFISVHMVL